MRVSAMVLLTVFTVLAPGELLSGVNPNNGNFYISYTDVVIDGYGLTRTYNSKSTFVGPFGYGWNAEFMTRLEVGPSGKPIVYNAGGGSKDYYEPVKPSDRFVQVWENSKSRLMEIKAEDLERGGSSVEESKRALENFAKELADVRTASARWSKYLGDSRVQPIEIPVGEGFQYTCECRFGSSTLRRTNNGYVQSYSNGDSRQFDASGALVRSLRGFNELSIERGLVDGHSLVNAIAINDQKIVFSYDQRGLILAARDTTENTEASYRYEGSNLVESVDVDGNRYTHEYDGVSNMTAITYEDGSEMLMNYSPEYFIDRISYPGGKVEEYDYGYLQDDPGKGYYTIAKTTFPRAARRWPRVERIEYHREFRGDRNVTYKSVVEADGIRKEINYDDAGQPVSITQTLLRTGVSTNINITLDDIGRVLTLKAPGWTRQHEYLNERDPGRTLVRTISGGDQLEHRFEYDQHGRVVLANYAGKRYELSYVGEEKSLPESVKSGDTVLRIVRTEDGRLAKVIVDEDRSVEFTARENGTIEISSGSTGDVLMVAAHLSGLSLVMSKSNSGYRLN